MYQVDSENANFLFLERAESPTHISLMYLYDQSSLGENPVRFTHIREHVRNYGNINRSTRGDQFAAVIAKFFGDIFEIVANQIAKTLFAF